MLGEISLAYVYQYSKIHLIRMDSRIRIDDNGTGGDSLTKIVHHQRSKDFLHDRIIFAGMKINHANRIFEVSVRSLYAPTEIVEFFDFLGGERKSI